MYLEWGPEGNALPGAAILRLRVHFRLRLDNIWVLLPGSVGETGILQLEMRDSFMRRTLLATALTLALLLTTAGAAGPPDEKPAPMKIKVGDMAPDFTLLAFDGKELKKVALHDYRGKKNVALAFYVFAFTGG
jgi:hypothetical protein